MRFTFAQKHMNLPKSIAITCSALIARALSGNALCAIAPQTRLENSQIC
jgi:hypothetical protein